MMTVQRRAVPAGALFSTAPGRAAQCLAVSKDQTRYLLGWFTQAGEALWHVHVPSGQLSWLFAESPVCIGEAEPGAEPCPTSRVEDIVRTVEVLPPEERARVLRMFS